MGGMRELSLDKGYAVTFGKIRFEPLHKSTRDKIAHEPGQRSGMKNTVKYFGNMEKNNDSWFPGLSRHGKEIDSIMWTGFGWMKIQPVRLTSTNKMKANPTHIALLDIP